MVDKARSPASLATNTNTLLHPSRASALPEDDLFNGIRSRNPQAISETLCDVLFRRDENLTSQHTYK